MSDLDPHPPVLDAHACDGVGASVLYARRVSLGKTTEVARMLPHRDTVGSQVLVGTAEGVAIAHAWGRSRRRPSTDPGGGGRSHDEVAADRQEWQHHSEPEYERFGVIVDADEPITGAPAMPTDALRPRLAQRRRTTARTDGGEERR